MEDNNLNMYVQTLIGAFSPPPSEGNDEEVASSGDEPYQDDFIVLPLPEEPEKEEDIEEAIEENIRRQDEQQEANKDWTDDIVTLLLPEENYDYCRSPLHDEDNYFVLPSPYEGDCFVLPSPYEGENAVLPSPYGNSVFWPAVFPPETVEDPWPQPSMVWDVEELLEETLLSAEAGIDVTIPAVEWDVNNLFIDCSGEVT